MDYVSKKIDVSRIQTAIQGVIICWSKLGLMLMHFIIRNRLSWPPVHLVSTLSLIADNGPSAEIHKTVSIFLRGKIYRSLVYPVVSKLGLNFFLNLYRCSNASSWNKMTKKIGEWIYTRVYDYGRHQKTYGADLNARCICGTRDVSGFTKENDFMSSWIASLWYTCLSPLTIKKVSAIGAKTNQHLSVRTTSVPFTINLCTRYRYPRNLLSSASGDRAHFHWSTGSNSREGKTPTPKQQAAIFLHPPTGSSWVSGALQSPWRFLWN